MTLTVMRRIHFNAGHRLLGHEGKCANFHGHNYVADIHVTSSGVDPVGRVIDFSRLRELLKGWIDEHWDHGFLLSEEDANGIAAMRAVRPSKLFLLPANPTAEMMARYLLETVCPQLLGPCGVRATRVELWETDEACAIATLDDFDDPPTGAV
jgi:6-pyruvoyltetrahydropterin/6-carboxytetrahydropterin synthase